MNSASRNRTIPLDEEEEYLSFFICTNVEYNLYDAINKLKDKYRKVFELFYINDMKISDIANALNISDATVKTRLKRAREEIKKHIEL